jgi:hypothetical protein
MNPAWLHFLQYSFSAMLLMTVFSALYLIRFLSR